MDNMPEPVILVASGDLRPAANRNCWPAQEKVEQAVTEAMRREGREVRRGHPYQPDKSHGFIDSQKYGMEVFRQIPPSAPVVVVEAVWQYSHHVLAGLYSHKAPILTVANWSGQWPGLVGMLNLNASLTKAGVHYDTLWSADFTDDFFLTGLRNWLHNRPVEHDATHVHSLKKLSLPADAENTGSDLARQLKHDKAIMGVFDEGCMGMYNAIIPDELLHPTGVFKERLSQSSLFAEMQNTSENEARDVRRWLDDRGMHFKTGPNAETDLTDNQILQQCRMYIAALRIAADFGCDAIGIQYQQGLKDLAPASDLAEGLLNNVERPPVHHRDSSRELFAGNALPHFNEVDECAGLDALVTNRVWRQLADAGAAQIHRERSVIHEDAAPHDFAGLADAFERAAPETKIHGRLALTHRAFVAVDEVLRRRGAGNFEHPDELALSVGLVFLAVAHVVQGGFRVEAELPPDAIGDQRIETGAFVHFIEMR